MKKLWKWWKKHQKWGWIGAALGVALTLMLPETNILVLWGVWLGVVASVITRDLVPLSVLAVIINAKLYALLFAFVHSKVKKR